MKKFKVGIQLYSIRDEMEKDMDATLKAVKEMVMTALSLRDFSIRQLKRLRLCLINTALKQSRFIRCRPVA